MESKSSSVIVSNGRGPLFCGIRPLSQKCFKFNLLFKLFTNINLMTSNVSRLVRQKESNSSGVNTVLFSQHFKKSSLFLKLYLTSSITPMVLTTDSYPFRPGVLPFLYRTRKSPGCISRLYEKEMYTFCSAYL